MRLRRETAEHPFGTLKMRMGATWIGAAFDPQSAPNIDPGLCEVIH
jgi:hypothetical protein